MIQQSQLVQVFQREVGTLVEFPLLRALFYSKAQYVAQRTLRQRYDIVVLRMRLGAPFLRIPQTVGHRCVLNTWVEHAVPQFLEEAGYASALIGQIVYRQTLAFQRIEETLADFLHAVFGRFPHLAQTPCVVVEESWLGHLLLQLLTNRLVFIAENVSPEGLDLRDDIP